LVGQQSRKERTKQERNCRDEMPTILCLVIWQQQKKEPAEKVLTIIQLVGWEPNNQKEKSCGGEVSMIIPANNCSFGW